MLDLFRGQISVGSLVALLDNMFVFVVRSEGEDVVVGGEVGLVEIGFVFDAQVRDFFEGEARRIVV